MKYLKILTLTSLAFVLLATSCREEAKDPPASFDPPVIEITNETPMVVNLYNPNDRPYIQGTVTTQGSLTNVTISVLAGGGTAVLQTVTDFGDNPQQFEINFSPNYAMGMTGIRVSATDAQNQTTTIDFPFQVVNQGTPTARPEIIFTTATGLIVNFNTVDFENLPRIQGRVTSENALTRVRIFRLIGTAQQEIEDITTFSNPLEFPFDAQLDFRPNMTGLRIVANDALGQTTIEDFPFQVMDFTMPTELTPATGNRLAFPTAEGAGRYTVGGRGGQVLFVTNLNNAGAGSLRSAIEHPGARTIVFDVSGNIHLTAALQIRNDSITIAGQTAPGDGITLTGHTVQNQANQVIVRYMRFRSGVTPGTGSNNERDAFEGNSRRNIILDHLSMSWGEDEVASWYNNAYFTMQWSIISEPLGSGTGRGMGGLMGGHTATFANNLFAHTRSRNPRINGARLSGRNPDLETADFVNNVMFNFATSPNGGELGRYNFRHNFFRPGLATPAGTVRNRFLNLYARNETTNNDATFRDLGWFYMTGNVMEGNATLTANNWNNVALQSDSRSRGANVNNVRVNEPFMAGWEIYMRSAEEAFEVVTERAGASLRRDAVDTRVIGEVRAGNATFGNGLVQGDVIPGGLPVLQSEPPAPRFLRGTANDDGIPDWFKIQHRLPLTQNMANRYSISPYYTNLEMYLNYIVQHIHQ